jgi:hypothetical protein
VLSVAGNNELCGLSQGIALIAINLKRSLRFCHQITRTTLGSV